MKELIKKNLTAIIIAVGIIVASCIYAYSQRYENYKSFRMDKWTGKAIKYDLKE